MLYILECMFYGLTCLYVGNDQPLQTTGEKITVNDVGVCLLGWSIVILVIFFVAYCIHFIAHKKKFSVGLLYIVECIGLGFLCLHGGTDVKLCSTGVKPSAKEVVFCIISWAYISLMIAAILLICI